MTRWPPLAAALAVALLLSAPLSGQRFSSSAVDALQYWMDAVQKHRAGLRDEWLESIVRLTYRDRATLDPAMSAFLALFAGDAGQQRTAKPSLVHQRALDLARTLQSGGESVLFLKRAAILHTDAAILRRRIGDIDDPTQPPIPFDVPTPRTPGGPPITSPLLDNRPQVLSRDGQVIGQAAADWNWPFARHIVDLVLRVAPRGEGPAFAGEWYHTTSAFMLANGLYAEAVPHLDRAVAIVPHDARVLFDRGCIAELFGLPMHQILRGQKTDAGIPSRDATNADAEAWFLRALEMDGQFAEARVRFARLQDVAGRHDQALVEIDRVLATTPTGVPAYFAHLFGGRAAEALGRLDDARHHYAEASSLFPDAQSALLARSETALRAGDISGALEVTTRLGERTANRAADPWWSYHLGAGRDFPALLGSLWDQFRR
jgi:tetratricopeptide (TPR) repeat protein